MESDGHKPVILKCMAGVREFINVSKSADLNVVSIVKDKLKGSLDWKFTCLFIVFTLIIKYVQQSKLFIWYFIIITIKWKNNVKKLK